jgi:hypothetical protein
VGRAYSAPTVEEHEGGFFITRVKDPDDEFSSVEYLAQTAYGRDGIEWIDYYSNEIVMFGRVTEAEQALMFYRAGQESVRASVTYE